jgi:phenylacetate-CoA ligase
MNPLCNPVFLFRVLKSYLLDLDRLRKMNNGELRRYQDKQLRKIVRFAYTVPLYHDKYKKAGVHPNDIKGINDIEKLPFVSKDDIKKYYPNGIVSSGIKQDSLLEISTSGTTGKKLSIFVDMFDIIVGLFGYLRTIREFGIHWRKTRMSIIGDFAPHTIESGYMRRGFQSRLKLDSFFRNIQWLDTNDDPKKIMREINRFKPLFIGGYAGMLGHLALLKEKGEGENVSPRYIASTGAVLDKKLKELIEKTFDAHLFEVYAATETGPIAFQCRHGGYHVMSDLVYPEFFKNGQPVSSGEPGKLVVTKLYGTGTPIIRYDAINDIVAPRYERCTCTLSGELIERIYGREDLCLMLPGGRGLLPSSISEIYSRVLHELKTNKLKDTRVIQHCLNKIEVQVVIDDKLRDKGPSVEEVLSVIKSGFREKTGDKVEIIMKEVKKVGKCEPRIVSKVDKSKFKIEQYI